MRREAKAKERRRTMFVVGAGILTSLLLIGVATAGIVVQNNNRAAKKKIVGLVTFDASKLGRKHTTAPVKYAQTPPVGGDHDPVWLNCGIYDKPVKVGSAVHDMEHGAVWITYDPKLPTAEVDKLRVAARTNGTYQGAPWTDITPFTGLNSGDIYASAWGYQLKLTNASDPRLIKFLTRFVHGPQTPEPTAACTGGTGTPIP